MCIDYLVVAMPIFESGILTMLLGVKGRAFMACWFLGLHVDFVGMVLLGLVPFHTFSGGNPLSVGTVKQASFKGLPL